jgi:hypothetical protein
MKEWYYQRDDGLEIPWTEEKAARIGMTMVERLEA